MFDSGLSGVSECRPSLPAGLGRPSLHERCYSNRLLTMRHGCWLGRTNPAFCLIALLLAFTMFPRSRSFAEDSLETKLVSRDELQARVRAASDWFLAVQNADGSFRYGWEPALDQDLLEESLIRQAGAAVAVSRCAALMNDDRLESAATRAIEYLLLQTKRAEGKFPTRRSAAPYQLVHPVGFSGLLLLAIMEHPSPTEAMRTGASELANYLRMRQRPDGSIRLSSSDDPAEDDEDDREHPGMPYYPGEALLALAKYESKNQVSPNNQAVRKSRDFYWRVWRRSKEPAFVPWQTAAHAELVSCTKDRASAEFVFEMNDWLIQLQYREDARAGWVGGFAAYVEGEMVAVEPGISSASYAESLADALRVARVMKDSVRERKYTEALFGVLRFINQLQYEPAGVSHFVPEYRSKLVGGFRAGLRQGTVRIDFTQHATLAMCNILAAESVPVATPVSASKEGRLSAGQGGSRK
ncbi:terpene cyclase/mutase family protein [bacterium]|nr:terpene cyclase/mutase family protein [bacterium]